MDKDTKLFDDITFADLIGEVYKNTKKKDEQINVLIAELKKLIKNVTDASMIVSLIKEYLDAAIKNDDNLVKLTAIVQRLIASEGRMPDDPLAMSETEKNQLIAAASEVLDASKAEVEIQTHE